MIGEALLYSIDCALDEAAEAGRFKHGPSDPATRTLFHKIIMGGGPTHMPPPQERQPVQTVMLVMDRETRRRLAAACGGAVRQSGTVGAQVVTYAGVPVVVDEEADGRIYVVSLRPMREDSDGH